MSFFVIGGLECYFPIVKNFIAFVLFVELPRGLAGEGGYKIEFLHLFVDYIMESPFVVTWTIPKFSRITLISFKETTKFKIRMD